MGKRNSESSGKTPTVFTLPLTPKLHATIQYLEERFEATKKTEAVRKALNRMEQLEKMLERGGELQVSNPNGSITKVLFI